MEGVKLLDVIKEKLQAERMHIGHTAEEIANDYTSSKLEKVNLHMCRIQAKLYKKAFVKYPNPNINPIPYWTFVDQDITNDINIFRLNYFGDLLRRFNVRRFYKGKNDLLK